jgi:hypothetical protein
MKFAAIPIAIAATMISVAAFARPQECRTGSGARGYQQGYALEENLLNRVWRTRFDCDTLEDFVYAIDVHFDPARTRSPYLNCRDAGIVEALQDQIEKRTNQCAHQCFRSGSEIGRLGGQQFCGLAVVTQVEIARIPLCQLTSIQGCRSAFRSYVNNNCPKEAENDRDFFEQFARDACKL